MVPLNYGGKLKIVEGDREVLPGITVHRVGGHTAGLQIVSVKTKSGTVVLTSDASHFYRNVETGQPTQIITSLPEMLAGFDRIHELAGKEKLIVAGHDPLVADRFKVSRARDHQDRLTGAVEGAWAGAGGHRASGAQKTCLRLVFSAHVGATDPPTHPALPSTAPGCRCGTAQ